MQDTTLHKRTNVLKQLPAALRAHLRSANIKDHDVGAITVKLQERLAGNILSYLQLSALKLRPNTGRDACAALEKHDERNTFTLQLADRVSASHF